MCLQSYVPPSLGWAPLHLISVSFALVIKGLRIPKDPRPPTRVSQTLARSLRIEAARPGLKFDLPGTAGELFDPVSFAYPFLARWLRKVGNANFEFCERPLLKTKEQSRKIHAVKRHDVRGGSVFQICVPIS